MAILWQQTIDGNHYEVRTAGGSVRAAIESSALLAIFPLQDLMSLGKEARMNTPGVPAGNWQWRYQPHQLDQLQSDSSTYLREHLALYGR